MKPKYFRSPLEFRAWLERNHTSATEVIVGYYKTGTGRPSMKWAESVDEALCFGWIDGIRHRVDDERYTNRFTPRRPRSNWSGVNIKRVQELTASGRMRPAGLAAYASRDEARSRVYSYEARHEAKLDAAYERRFRARKKAWAFFTGRPPSARQVAIFWVMSARKPETRERRLEALIEASANGTTPPPLSQPGRKA